MVIDLKLMLNIKGCEQKGWIDGSRWILKHVPVHDLLQYKFSGSWGDVNKVLIKCLNDELYICEGLVNILHVCVLQKCTDAMLHGHMIKHLEMVEMHAGYLRMVGCMY